MRNIDNEFIRQGEYNFSISSSSRSRRVFEPSRLNLQLGKPRRGIEAMGTIKENERHYFKRFVAIHLYSILHSGPSSGPTVSASTQKSENKGVIFCNNFAHGLYKQQIVTFKQK
jgi:hypothetical protein